MKQFLVCSSDDAMSRSFGYVVEAETEVQARNTYLRQVYAKEQVFRDSVLDRAMNLSFLERFYIQTPQESYRFDETGLPSVTDEMVADRIRHFFAAKPEFGEAFLAYVGDGEISRVTDELFEFIAVNDDQGGVDVIDIATLPRLNSRR